MINMNKSIIPIYDDLNFILQNCEGLILDIWGVLWDGLEPYEKSIGKGGISVSDKILVNNRAVLRVLEKKPIKCYD